MGSLMALGPFSIDMYLPAFPSIAQSLGTDTAKLGYTLTSYFAGLLVGQLIYGILIDRFGRKRPLIIGLLIFITGSLGCALAPSLGLLVFFRFVMAIGGCVGMVVSRAVVRDVFESHEIAKIFSQLMLVMGIAPIIAPTIGGIINNALGWQWVFGMIIAIGVVMLSSVLILLPETKAPDHQVSLRPSKIWPEYYKVLSDKTFIIFALAGSFGYSGMFAYIAGSPAVFMEGFGFTDQQYGWAFALNAGGLIIGSQVNRIVLKRINELKASIRAGIGVVALATGLLTFSYLGWAGAAFTLCCTFLFLFMLGILNPNTQAMALVPFIRAAGRSAALLGSLQMGAGVIASWMVSFLSNGERPAMAIVMLSCATLSLIMLWIGTSVEINRKVE